MADNEKNSSTSGAGAVVGGLAAGTAARAVGLKGVGIAAGALGAVGIPAVVVGGLAIAAGAYIGNKVEEILNDDKK